MKLKLSIIGLALLASASPSFAGGIMMMGGGVAATGGGSDGTIGTITHNGTQGVYVGVGMLTSFQPTAAGNVRYAHVYITDGNLSEALCVSLHSSDGTVLAYGSSGTLSNNTAEWVNIDFGSAVSITATDYWIAVQSGTSVTMGRNTTGNGVRIDASLSYSCGTNISNDGADNTGALTVLINNTAGSPE